MTCPRRPAPSPPSNLDFEGLATRLAASEAPKNCTERGLHIEAVATRSDPNYRLYCLDTSVHVWLDPDLQPYQQGIDIRSAAGLQTALTDLRRVAGSTTINNFAIQYGGTGDQVSIEVPGECGNSVDCPAFELSRTPPDRPGRTDRHSRGHAAAELRHPDRVRHDRPEQPVRGDPLVPAGTRNQRYRPADDHGVPGG